MIACFGNLTQGDLAIIAFALIALVGILCGTIIAVIEKRQQRSR